jgi:hypothetical protein
MSSPCSLSRIGWVVLAFAFTQLGCAAGKPGLRDQKLQELAGKYVYNEPLEKIWPEARKLIAEAGYEPRESDDAFQLVTDWKEQIGGSIGKIWVQYLVWGERLEADRSIIRFERSQVVLVPNEVRSTTSDHSGGGMQQVNPLKTGTPLGLRLRFKKAEDRAASGTTETADRDLGLEWKLLERVKPDIARQLEQVAAKP